MHCKLKYLALSIFRKVREHTAAQKKIGTSSHPHSRIGLDGRVSRGDTQNRFVVLINRVLL